MAQVQFILGRSGTGKSRWCIDAVCGALASGGSDPLILLVPEQATYQVERAILSHPEISGFSRLMVLSFNRLAFRLAPLAASGAELSTAGKQMILHRLLLETADQLTVYKTPAATMGLAAKLTDLLSDLQHHNCSARQIALLAEQLAHKPGQMLAAKKWGDIATVFAAYEACFADADNHFSNPDTELDAAKERAAAATFLDGARVWVDGFSGFSVQEQNLLAELLKRSSGASIALCLDPTQLDLSSNDESTLDPYSLFASAEQTYCQLLRLIRNCKLSLAEPVLLDTPWRFADAAPLAALEANLAADSPTEPVAANGAIRIEACATVRAETLRTAAHIRDLVKNHSYRYRQIAVVVPDMDGYRHYLESAFRQYDLPYFLDRPRQMKTHPLIELIGAALQAVGGNFRLSDILSYLKSPLTGTAGEQVDALENYCRAFDIQSPEWRQNQDKKTLKEDQMDALRRKVIAPLRQLQKALTDEPLIPVDSFIQALWQLLETLSVRNMMADWAAEDPADQHGHRQVFSRLLEITDEMAAIFDGVEMAPQAWMSILSDVLSSAAIKLIPPSLDQVLVGSIERSRHPDIKAVFLIGVAQKQFPVPTMSEKLLTEQDYQSAADLKLANPYDQHLTHRPYLSYIALTRASHRLYLSYPLTDEKGGQVVRWSGIDRLAALFTDVAVEFIETAPAPETIETHPQLARWLCEKLGADNPHPDSTASVAAGVLEQIAAGDNTLKQTATAKQPTRSSSFR
ncbi:MAG: PD-(D/E)XK nuclease family protein [Planctomycetota bacterium]|jgi:ATP-dependent helicase/nuclease subunit B